MLSSPSLSYEQSDSNIRTVCGTFPGVKFAIDQLPDPPSPPKPRKTFTHALETAAPNTTFLQSYAGYVHMFVHCNHYLKYPSDQRRHDSCYLLCDFTNHCRLSKHAPEYKFRGYFSFHHHRAIVARFGYDLRHGRYVASLGGDVANFSKRKEFYYPFTNTTYSVADGLTVAGNPLGCARLDLNT